MGVKEAWDYFWFGPRQPAPPPAPAPAPEARAPRPMATPSGRAIVGGRQSVNKDGQSGLGAAWVTILPPDSWERHWRTHALDARSLERYAPADLLHILTNLSPDVSRALWDFLRLCNPGWEAKALRPGTEEEEPRGQAVVDGAIARLSALYGTPDVLWSRLFINLFLRGAILCEGVFDMAGRELADVAVPDAASARFRRIDDPVRGQTWQMGQMQRGRFVPLDRETIVYIPIDPLPDSPYGRPMAAPALFTTVFEMGMFSDLRRVIQQQGWPRRDVKIITEMAKSMLSAADQADPARLGEFMDFIIGKVEEKLASLGPDDTFIHNDAIEMGRADGGIDASSLSAVDGLMGALDRKMMRALKSSPLLFGLDQSVSEANANRDYEKQVQSIKAIQHYVETAIGRLLTLACQAQGVQCECRLTFAENRASEEQRDELTRKTKYENILLAYQAGWIGQGEAAMEAVGHEPDAPEPRAVAAPPTGDSESEMGPDASEERAAPTNGHRDPALASLAAIYGMDRRG